MLFKDRAYVIKLVPKGYKRKINYDIVIMRRKRGLQGRRIAKLGQLIRYKDINIIKINKSKLALWSQRGLRIPRYLQKYIALIKFEEK